MKVDKLSDQEWMYWRPGYLTIPDYSWLSIEFDLILKLPSSDGKLIKLCLIGNLNMVVSKNKLSKGYKYGSVR